MDMNWCLQSLVLHLMLCRQFFRHLLKYRI
uniref:Uncharacterized protein n=1 Tax=Musa acuminata subsp. malaccensis TaxID=214687 RepID=A0A804KC08_MUSAM